MAGDLATLLADLKEEEAIKVTKERLEKGEDPMKILEDSRKGMEIVGKRFASGEYFIPDLIYSGEILKQISEIVKPKLSGGLQTKKIGKFLLATVAGDIHDIGKDIVGFMMDISGFEVIDLGIDVPKEKIVEKIKETKPQIVGLSGFLTLAFDSMKETIDAIKAAGLRDKVKIMIGGGQIDEEVRKYTGADAYRPDAVSAVALA
ncbi:MAG: cobalamin-dependent protein, partial [Dehalococcoidales bacterium]|nr:cobalamin-dependent protein [Dehalococcoidales bacterium]